MKPIPNYEGLYAVTEDGKVWSHRRKRFLKNTVQNYLSVSLFKNGQGKQFYVHRLVAMVYIPNPNNYPEVNHKDENKLNPHVSNLEWCDRKYNIQYGTRTERTRKPVYCVELDKTFPSVIATSKELGLDLGGVYYCCRGMIETVKGYHLQYAKDVL